MHSLLQRLRNGSGPVSTGDLLAPELYRFGPWAETAVITLIACALGWWAAPDDPLLQHSGFPWLWLAPVLVALRYGVMPGIFSAIGLLGDWGLLLALSEQAPDLPRAYFVGGVLLVLICGEFHAVWSNRVERRNEANAYLDERLNRLTRRYLLLRLSHDRIEQELLVKPGSLRDALLRLREINPGAAPDTPLPDIDELLALMAQYCQLEAAAVYLVPQDDGDAPVLSAPLTVIGKPPQLQADDPMLLRALERRSLVHIAEQAEASHLVVAPILTSDDRLLGILAVSHMPFFALNRENLQLLDLLLGYYADVVQGGDEAQRLRLELPGCPWPFVEELVRVQRIQQRVGVASHVVVFRFSGDQAFEIAGEVERMRRGLDVIWPVDTGTHAALAVLLPLSSSAASEGYILRIEHWLKDRYGIDSDTAGYGIVDIDLARGDALQRLRQALLMDTAAA
jgi:hypothetical protein